MHKVWTATSRADPTRVHVLAAADVGFVGLLKGRRVDAVVTNLDEATVPTLRDSAFALWCVGWLGEMRQVAQDTTRVAVATHFRRGQVVADALEVAGWSWQGLGGLASDRVVLWGSADPDSMDPPSVPGADESLLVWLSSNLDRRFLTVIDPLGGSTNLRECEALGLRLMGRAQSGAPQLVGFSPDFEFASCHKHSGVWQAAVLQLLSEGKGLKVAAELCGIHYSTVYKARYRSACFSRAIDLARGRC